MLRGLVKAITPEFVLQYRRRRRYNPRLATMGVPPRLAAPPVRFLGTEYGGFAIDPELIGNDAVVYTLGAGLDVSFEEELIKRTGCHVHIYDPTPRSVTWLNGRFGPTGMDPLAAQITVHPLGIWSSNDTLRFYVPENPANVSHSLTNLQNTADYIEVDCITLQTAMQKNGHERIDVLKLNVEGAEYAILNCAFDDGIRPRLLLVNYDEIHTEGDDGAPGRLRQIASRSAELGYRPVYADLARVTYVLQ